MTYLKVDRAEAELLTGSERPARRPPASWPPTARGRSCSPNLRGHRLCRRTASTRPLLRPARWPGAPAAATPAFHLPGQRLSGSPDEATLLAGAVTTLKQEKPGPWQGPLADAEALMRQWEAEELISRC